MCAIYPLVHLRHGIDPLVILRVTHIYTPQRQKGYEVSVVPCTCIAARKTVIGNASCIVGSLYTKNSG